MKKLIEKIKKQRQEEEENPGGGSASLKTSKSAKYILLVGDEGAILVYLKDNVVLSRQFVPDASQHNLNELKQALSKDESAPVMMVIDTMDQSYVQQTLPPVSKFSVNKLIQRRLDREFGNSEIKGSVLLTREKGGRKDWNFLMIAVEKSPQITVWLDFVTELPHRFLGIHLVSVETEILLKNLERAMGISKEKSGAQWKFFVSHNKVGGFRQVVLRNGRIIFTRLAQPVGEASPEVIAGNIEQEMLNTIEYMKRVSYDVDAGLDIYIVASGNIKTAIDMQKFNFAEMYMLTPFEVAQYLGIEGGTQPTDQFGDVVLAASIGRSKKHILTLGTPLSKKLDTWFKLLGLQRAAAALAIAAVLLYCLSLGWDTLALAQKTRELERHRQESQKSIDDLRAEIRKSDLDVEKADDLIDLYKQLMAERASPIPVVKTLSAAKSPVWIKGVDWVLDGTTRPAAAPEGAKSADKMSAELTIEFPDETNNSEVFRAVAKKVLTTFKEAFKGYEVQYTVLPSGFLENDKLDITFDSNKTESAQAAAGRMAEAKIVIKGGANPEPPKASP